jgi:chromosome partitioning protein
MFGAEVELATQQGRQGLMTKALAPITDRFRFIFLDCPPSLGVLTLNALTACQGVMIPLQCEYYALEGLTQLLHTVTRVRRGMNPSLALEGILLTMFDIRNNLSRQVAEDVRQHFGARVFNTIIPRNVRLSEAPSHGQPVLLYDSASTGARAYISLAKEILAGRASRTKAPAAGDAAA